jgi:16S rRNA G966 N2-methylase RsmD
LERDTLQLYLKPKKGCEIEENIAFSLCQDEDCLEEIIQINQVADLVILDPPHNVKTYLQREREEVANQVVGHMMSLLGKDKEPTSEEIPPPIKEILKVERK